MIKNIIIITLLACTISVNYSPCEYVHDTGTYELDPPYFDPEVDYVDSEYDISTYELTE